MGMPSRLSLHCQQAAWQASTVVTAGLVQKCISLRKSMWFCLHRVSVTVKARLCHHRLCTDDQGAEEQCRDGGDICATGGVTRLCPIA